MPPNVSDDQIDGFRLEHFMPYRLAVMAEQLSHFFASLYDSRFNLTISEWRLLAVIAEFGTLSPTMACQHTAMDKVRVSRAAQTLVTKGLLRQNKDPRDGRGRLLRLTRRGRTTYAGMVPLARAAEADLFGGLSRPERAALDRILAKIISRMETNGTRTDDT
jgi:DNA-binding MarR family transcriptional regulator